MSSSCHPYKSPVCQSFLVPQQARHVPGQTRHGLHTDTELDETPLSAGIGFKEGAVVSSQKGSGHLFHKKMKEKSSGHGAKVVQVSCC